MQRSKDFIAYVKAMDLDPWHIERIDSYIPNYSINKGRYCVYTLEKSEYMLQIGRYIFREHETEPVDIRYSEKNTRDDWMNCQFMLFPQHDDKDFNLAMPIKKLIHKGKGHEIETYVPDY